MPLLFENSPEISVLLATLRPAKARKCIESIADTSEGVNYEVVVVSSLDMPDLLAGVKGYDRLRFVKEEKREGCNKAFSLACENAAGKYVFAIADDHRLGQDCLKNLIEFMRPHDQELFLAGARCCGLYGAAPECKTYGFYYAFNPCIRREIAKQIGGFYDPYYKSYYGDPDLSMRVWLNGGRVELCPDAWVVFRNECDDLDYESHTDYAERDFQAFFKRWHPVYGHLAGSGKETDINKGNPLAFPGIPPEKCIRLIVFLRKRDWPALKSELENENNFRVTRDYLFYVLEDMLRHLDWIYIPVEVQQGLAKWLIKQILAPTLIEASQKAAVFETKYAPEDNYDTEASNIALARIAMFFLVRGTLKREPEIIIENYKGISLIYSLRKFYAWPCSYGGFSVRAFKTRTDSIAFSESSIYQAMLNIEKLAGNTTTDWQRLRDIEDFYSTGSSARRANDENSLRVFEKLPDEICLKLLFCLNLKDWTGIERLLNKAKESEFLIRRHLSLVYGEILRESQRLPANILLMLSQWLWNKLRASSASVKNITAEQDHSNIRLLVHEYRHYDIVYYKGRYYGWPLSAGGFSPEKVTDGIASTAVLGRSPIDVKRLIDQNSGRPNRDEENQPDWVMIQQNETLITHNEVKDLDNDIRLVVHGYRQYNIVHCKGLYYGWPWPAGRFSLMRYLNGFDRAAVAGKSVMEVKNLIDAKLGPPAVEEENQHDWQAIQQNEA